MTSRNRRNGLQRETVIEDVRENRSRLGENSRVACRRRNDEQRMERQKTWSMVIKQKSGVHQDRNHARGKLQEKERITEGESTRKPQKGAGEGEGPSNSNHCSPVSQAPDWRTLL